MKKQELLEIIGKSQSSVMRELLTKSVNESDSKVNRKFARMLESFENRVKNDLNYRAKAIAAYIRLNMEDFHSEHLTNAQMKELNPLIRNAIYTFLKDEENRNIYDMFCLCGLNLAPYWEDCEYVHSTHTCEDSLDED